MQVKGWSSSGRLGVAVEGMKKRRNEGRNIEDEDYISDTDLVET